MISTLCCSLWQQPPSKVLIIFMNISTGNLSRAASCSTVNLVWRYNESSISQALQSQPFFLLVEAQMKTAAQYRWSSQCVRPQASTVRLVVSERGSNGRRRLQKCFVHALRPATFSLWNSILQDVCASHAGGLRLMEWKNKTNNAFG